MKGIEIFDDVLSYEKRRRVFEIAHKSLFQIGWEDSPELDKRHQPCLHSRYNWEDIKNLNVWDDFKKVFQKSAFKKILNEEHYKETILNLTKPGDINYTHTHDNIVAVLYYINPTWNVEWGGETLFFNDGTDKIISANQFTPNRMIVFDGAVPHTIKCQNHEGPAYRFTLSMFFLK